MKARYQSLTTLFVPLMASALLSLALIGVARERTARSRDRATGGAVEGAAGPFFDQLRVGAPIPSNLLFDRSGREYCLADFRGRRVMLALFDTCPRCLRAAGKWQTIGKREPDLIVVGLSIKGPQGTLEFGQATNVTFPLLFDPDYHLTQADRLPKCPGSVFIAADGTVDALERLP